MAETAPGTLHPKKSTSARKRQRRISKHILQAQHKQKYITHPNKSTDSAPLVPPTATPRKAITKVKPPPTSKKQDIKDPSEALNYLHSWKRHQTNPQEHAWKFNKNTQFWLIRHMYEADKIPKSSFDVLLDYLAKLQGATAQERIVAEAHRRAVRYQQGTLTRGTVPETAAPTETPAVDASIEAVAAVHEEEARWSQLDEHAQRKEYKRARKILDLFHKKESSQAEAS
jgi:hypothetical protein